MHPTPACSSVACLVSLLNFPFYFSSLSVLSCALVFMFELKYHVYSPFFVTLSRFIFVTPPSLLQCACFVCLKCFEVFLSVVESFEVF